MSLKGGKGRFDREWLKEEIGKKIKLFLFLDRLFNKLVAFKMSAAFLLFLF